MSLAQSRVAVCGTGLSDCHRGEPDKPNEDYFFLNSNQGLAIIADGVTQHRDRDGHYPGDSFLASAVFVDAAVLSMSVQKFLRPTDGSTDIVIRAFMDGNEEIRKANEERGLVYGTEDFFRHECFATTAALVLVDKKSLTATVGSIGDSMVFYLPKGDVPELLTEDQLAGFNRWKSRLEKQLRGAGLPEQEVKRELLLRRWRDVRNRKDAVDELGNPIGYGVLNGEPHAIGFLQMVETDVRAGDRFILCSDAMRACSKARAEEAETAKHYAELLDIAKVLLPEHTFWHLKDQIRKSEKQRKVRSDDATVVIMDIG